MRVERIDCKKSAFGMALSRPSERKITKKIGMLAARQFEIAQPRLEALAKDKDIEVSIIEAKDFSSRGFKITISDIVKNPIIKFLGLYNKSSVNVMMGEVLGRKENLSNLLCIKAGRLKQEFSTLQNMLR